MNRFLWELTGRPEWGWALMPVFIVAFVILGLRLGSQIWPTTDVVREIVLVQTSPGHSRGLAHVFVAATTATQSREAWMAPTSADQTVSILNGARQRGFEDPVLLHVQTGTSRRIAGLKMPPRSTQSFEATGPVNLKGGFKIVESTPEGVTLRNDTGLDFEQAFVALPGSVGTPIALGPLLAGRGVQFKWDAARSSASLTQTVDALSAHLGCGPTLVNHMYKLATAGSTPVVFATSRQLDAVAQTDLTLAGPDPGQPIPPPTRRRVTLLSCAIDQANGSTGEPR